MVKAKRLMTRKFGEHAYEFSGHFRTKKGAQARARRWGKTDLWGKYLKTRIVLGPEGEGYDLYVCHEKRFSRALKTPRFKVGHYGILKTEKETERLKKAGKL